MSELRDFTIFHASLEQVRSNALGQRLRRFNSEVIGKYEVQPVSFDAVDSASNLLGGLRGVFAFQWLIIQSLWVFPESRGRGIGSALLRAAESHALSHQIWNSWLNAFSWQNVDYLRAQGYAEFTNIANYIKGNSLLFMRKSITANNSAAPAPKGVHLESPGSEVNERTLSLQSQAVDSQFVGPSKFEALRLAVRKHDGQVIGGLSADLEMGWLKINVLVLDEDVRHRGLGTRLLHAAEQFALASGINRIWLETFDWQAPEFYQSRGYEKFGRIENYVPGHGLSFFRRDI